MKKLLTATALGLVAVVSAAQADPIELFGLGWGDRGLDAFLNELDYTGEMVCDANPGDPYIIDCERNGRQFVTIDIWDNIMQFGCDFCFDGASLEYVTQTLIDTFDYQAAGITQFDYVGDRGVKTAYYRMYSKESWNGYCATGIEGDRICTYERFISTEIPQTPHPGIVIYKGDMQGRDLAHLIEYFGYMEGSGY